MTAEGAAERLSRIAPNSMTEHRKPEQRDKLRRKNMRHSATKITSIVFCAAQRTKIQMLVGDTPSPEITAQRSENNRLTPK